MLVKFHSSTSGEVLMFAEVARQVVAILEKEALARGVITTEQLPEAIARIEAALAVARGERPPADDDAAMPIGLAQRLVPFLQLLQRTRDDDGYVMWEAAADFAA